MALTIEKRTASALQQHLFDDAIEIVLSFLRIEVGKTLSFREFIQYIEVFKHKEEKDSFLYSHYTHSGIMYYSFEVFRPCLWGKPDTVIVREDCYWLFSDRDYSFLFCPKKGSSFHVRCTQLLHPPVDMRRCPTFRILDSP